MRPKRFDENEAMLLQSILIAVAFWLTMLSLVFLSACTPTVKHEVPQLDAASDSIRKASDSIRKIVIAGCEKPTLAMPPIPQDVVLDIKGDKIAANEGGELLLRYYSRARQLLKPDAPTSTKPTTTP